MKNPDNVEHLYYFELFLLAFFMIAGFLIASFLIFDSKPTPVDYPKENIETIHL